MYSLLNYHKIFNEFSGRDTKLAEVKRFKIYKPMYYRSDLITHSKHVFWLIQSLFPAIFAVYGEKFDYTKAQLMAAVHDDPEVIMGDVEAGIKRKMSKQQLLELDQIELRAIDELTATSPQKIMGYSYKKLMQEAVGLKTLEAKIGKFADKFDAHGESLHEVYAGNLVFITPIVNEWGTIDLPAPFYVRFLSEFKQKNPDLARLYETDNVVLTGPTTLDYESIINSHSPHTLNSLKNKTGNIHYDFWKNLILNSSDNREINKLFIKSE